MPKVYIPQTSHHDYSKAERFGELVYLTQGRVNVFGTQALFERVMEIMDKSGPDDYVLMSGSNIVSGFALALMAAIHGRINILIYNGEGSYEARNIVIPPE